MSLLFVAPIACETCPVPTSAGKAAVQIQTSVRSALAVGKRRVSVDVLIASIDARSRTYDDIAAKAIFASLLQAVRPILPNVRVVLPGSTAALRVRRWLSSESMENVSVGVLGVDDLVASTGALLVIDPPCKGDGLQDLRRLIRDAHDKNLPVLLQNQPREDELYKLLGYGGGIPFELVRYEPVFVLAPFALQGNPNAPPTRFVLFRKFPGKWELWRHFGPIDDKPFGISEKKGTYELLQEFENRPSDNALMLAVSNSLKSP